MKHQSQSQNFEKLLDQALSNYAPPDPRPGLEQRILAHMKAHTAAHPDLPPRRRFRWRWQWIGAGLATAAVALILVLVMIPSNCVSCSDATKLARRQPVPSATPAAPPAAPVQVRLASPVQRSRRPALRHVVAASVELTSQERLLSQFAARHPDAALALAKTAPSLSQPITVKPLDAEPIHLEALSIRPIDIEPLDLTAPKPPSY